MEAALGGKAYDFIVAEPYRWAIWAAPKTADGKIDYNHVTPEYNFGYNAALKNAIDYLSGEWANKAIGFVSYGGVAAGTRAVQQLKQVLTALKMVTVAESVNIPFFTQFIDEAGHVRASEVMTRAADAMLDELLRITTLLRPNSDKPAESAVLVS